MDKERILIQVFFQKSSYFENSHNISHKDRQMEQVRPSNPGVPEIASHL